MGLTAGSGWEGLDLRERCRAALSGRGRERVFHAGEQPGDEARVEQGAVLVIDRDIRAP